MTLAQRSLIDVVVREPAALAAAVPHQVLISSASVAILANYASDSGFILWPMNYVLAIGVEWAWLRGMASARETASAWVGRLNWAAFGVLVLWGLLWGLKVYRVLPEIPGPVLGAVLAASHILPMAYLGLCAAMVHRDAERERAVQEAQQQATIDAEAAQQQAIAEAEAEAARKLAQRRAEEQAALEARYREERLTLELEDERLRRAAERRRDGHKRVREVSQNTVTEQFVTGVTAHSDTERVVLRSRIVTVIRDTPADQLNVSQIAREIGISRAMWYKLRAEAVQLGELSGEAESTKAEL